jgi:hypothetical protein
MKLLYPALFTLAASMPLTEEEAKASAKVAANNWMAESGYDKVLENLKSKYNFLKIDEFTASINSKIAEIDIEDLKLDEAEEAYKKLAIDFVNAQAEAIKQDTSSALEKADEIINIKTLTGMTQAEVDDQLAGLDAQLAEINKSVDAVKGCTDNKEDCQDKIKVEIQNTFQSLISGLGDLIPQA